MPSPDPLDHPRPRASREHLQPLDGIRGLAILMVLACHAFASNSWAGGPLIRAVGATLLYGKFGVDLFFVLSGFLITRILLDTRQQTHFFRTFYARRILRIFPLYYAVLLLLFALTPILHLHWQGMGWLMLFDLQNLRPAQIETFAPTPSIGLYHFWSLAVEEQFYLLWPAAIFWIRDRRTLFHATLALAAAALALRLTLIATGTAVLAIHVDTLCRADSLLLGAALAMLHRSRHWPGVLRHAPAAFSVTFAIFIASILLLSGQEDLHTATGLRTGPAVFWIEGLRYTLLALCCAALIAWSLRPASAPSRIFDHPALRFFGKYSYGIYILHVILLTLFLPSIRTLLRAATHSKGVAVAGSGFIAIALSVVVAMLSYHLLEMPFLRLKRLFPYTSTPATPASRPGTISLPRAIPAWSYRTPSGTLEDVVEEPSHTASTVYHR